MLSDQRAKPDGIELRLIYMNGSVLPVGAHEMVSAIRSPVARIVLIVLSVVLALPETELARGVPIWARMILNALSCLAFIELLSAAVAWLAFLAREKGSDRVFLSRASVLTTLLVVLLSESIKLIVLGIPIERPVLLTNLLVSFLFWETVIFVMVWFYIPALAAEIAATGQMNDNGPKTVALGPTAFDPAQLLRVETSGRHLILHFENEVQTVPVRMRDALNVLKPYGVAVHRCHWVAFGQLGPIRTEGRSLIMTSRSGSQIPVSRERRAAIEALLAGDSPT